MNWTATDKVDKAYQCKKRYRTTSKFIAMLAAVADRFEECLKPLRCCLKLTVKPDSDGAMKLKSLTSVTVFVRRSGKILSPVEMLAHLRVRVE
jgi:hypothetical protein